MSRRRAPINKTAQAIDARQRERESASKYIYEGVRLGNLRVLERLDSKMEPVHKSYWRTVCLNCGAEVVYSYSTLKLRHDTEARNAIPAFSSCKICRRLPHIKNEDINFKGGGVPDSDRARLWYKCVAAGWKMPSQEELDCMSESRRRGWEEWRILGVFE